MINCVKVFYNWLTSVHSKYRRFLDKMRRHLSEARRQFVGKLFVVWTTSWLGQLVHTGVFVVLSHPVTQKMKRGWRVIAAWMDKYEPFFFGVYLVMFCLTPLYYLVVYYYCYFPYPSTEFRLNCEVFVTSFVCLIAFGFMLCKRTDKRPTIYQAIGKAYEPVIHVVLFILFCMLGRKIFIGDDSLLG